MVHGLIKQFLTDVQWGELDYLIVDMPPGTGDAALTLTQMAPLSGAVIVTTANDLSLIDARKGLADVREGRASRSSASSRTCRTSRRRICRTASTTSSARAAASASRKSSASTSSARSRSTRASPRTATSGKPIVVEPAGLALERGVPRIAGEVVRKVAMLAVKNPPLADANITWVSS